MLDRLMHDGGVVGLGGHTLRCSLALNHYHIICLTHTTPSEWRTPTQLIISPHIATSSYSMFTFYRATVVKSVQTHRTVEIQ